MVPLEGMAYGEKRNQATLYDSRVIQISLDSLYSRFSHLKLNHFYPLIHTTSEIILGAEPERYDVSDLPLIIRERDAEYQFHRVVLFRRLLHVSLKIAMRSKMIDACLILITSFQSCNFLILLTLPY